MDLYIALMGDIVGSKKLDIVRRNQVQINLSNILKKANLQYRDYIVSDLRIVGGDGIQGLMLPEVPIYEVICYIMEGINHPSEDEEFLQLRFGIGFGRTYTEVNKDSQVVDGPVFHCAKLAIESSKEKKDHTIVFKAEQGLIKEVDELSISTMLELLAITRKFWINKVNAFTKILPYLRENMYQKDIAQKLNCSQPYISSQIYAAYWNEVKEIEKKVCQIIKKYIIS
ncbi:SatD family protein [Desulfosporosinus shakirovi]|uniref:SatD family protein n=1 Tax=Desulfosporosinus shakirovi TaxID=2885154 RepID=UPI001E4CE755|nr:SatD family protein [Desulfosporosinus sp. SRJS8]MCB8816131.1 SatD family protein [Desulfosporosinus sp. SRJS8]